MSIREVTMRILLIGTISLLCSCFLFGCTGSGSGPATLDPDKADSRQAEEAPAQVRIAMGMPQTRVLDLLGSADAVDADEQGRQVWSYKTGSVEYVYVSNADNVSALVLGNYDKEKVGGLPIFLSIVFDKSNVADFSFSHIGM